MSDKQLHISDTITQQELTEFFFSDPNIAYIGLSDEELGIMYKTKKYPLHSGSTYLGVYDGGELVAVAKYEMFTANCINFHMYIHSVYHNTFNVKEYSEVIEEKLRDNPDIYKMIVMVPTPCLHVHAFAKRYGMEKEGFIKECFKWRQEVTDLTIYGMPLR